MAKTQKNSKTKEKKANVVLPGEMRPLLDKAQEMLEKTTWTETVQILLENYTEDKKTGSGELENLKQIEEIKEAAVADAIERISEAFVFVFKSADLKIEKKLVSEALNSIVKDSSPIHFAEFMLKLYREIEQSDEGRKQTQKRLDNLQSKLEKIMEHVNKIETAMLQSKPPQVVIKNADADAESEADADADSDG